MNQIQLELFSRDMIRVGSNPSRQVVCFEFEGQKAWTNYCRIGSIRVILQTSGAAEFLDIFDNAYCNQLFSHNFSCDGGTWEKLSRKEEFRSVSSWGDPLFQVQVI